MILMGIAGILMSDQIKSAESVLDNHELMSDLLPFDLYQPLFHDCNPLRERFVVLVQSRDYNRVLKID